MAFEWNIPTSDDPAGKFYIRLGMALEQWQVLELWLFHIYWVLIGSPSRDIAAVAYYNISQFRVQLEMVNEIAKFRLGDGPLRDEWDKLFDRLFRAMRRRNEMVHIQFVNLPDANNYVGVPNILDPRNKKTFYETGFPTEISQKFFTARRLEQFRNIFYCVRKREVEFFEKLRGFFPPQ